MNEQQAKNRQRIIAAEAIGNAVLLREVTYLRGRIERLEAQVVTLEEQLAATTASRDRWRSGYLAKRMAEDAEGERKPGDSHEYSEPKPLDFNSMLDYLKARVEYHDRDERDGDETPR